MSDTPRTDAEFSDDYYTSGFVRTEFAQQLERELATAMEQRDKLADALNSIKRRTPSIYASKWERGK